jgi:hypothetical protein
LGYKRFITSQNLEGLVHIRLYRLYYTESITWGSMARCLDTEAASQWKMYQNLNRVLMPTGAHHFPSYPELIRSTLTEQRTFKISCAKEGQRRWGAVTLK